MKGYWDIHNHILPGIDDGASCLPETAGLLEEAYSQGVSNIVFTPHYRKGMFEISPEHRINAFEMVKQLYSSNLSAQMPGMSFRLGCEFHVHGADPALLEKDIYRMPGSRLVLAEFGYPDNYDVLSRRIADLNERGWRVIIAHIERYKLDAADAAKLAAGNDVIIQVNSGSLTGSEGFMTARRSRRMLDAGIVKLIGSDTHDVSKRRMNIGKCAAWLEKQAGAAAVTELLINNPSRLFSQDSDEQKKEKTD